MRFGFRLKPSFIEAADTLEPIILVSVIWLGAMISACTNSRSCAGCGLTSFRPNDGETFSISRIGKARTMGDLNGAIYYPLVSTSVQSSEAPKSVKSPQATKVADGRVKTNAAESATMRGRLKFYAETGTEGGHWAFQDQEFVHLQPPEYGVNGQERVWDTHSPQRTGKVQTLEVLMDGEYLPFPDPLQNDPLYYRSSLFMGERRGDREADAQLAQKYGFELEYGRNEGMGTPKTTPWRPYGISHGQPTRAQVLWEDGECEWRTSELLLVERWEYAGLHILKNGDTLTIFEEDDPQVVRWHGEIALVQFPLFSEDAFGYWIHTDMKGWERGEWAKFFFDGYPAQLVVA